MMAHSCFCNHSNIRRVVWSVIHPPPSIMEYSVLTFSNRKNRITRLMFLLLYRYYNYYVLRDYMYQMSGRFYLVFERDNNMSIFKWHFREPILFDIASLSHNVGMFHLQYICILVLIMVLQLTSGFLIVHLRHDVGIY